MKKSNKEQSRCYVFSLIISLYIVFISFFLERLWFDMDSLKNHFMIYTVSKILLFGLSFMMCFSFQKLKKNGYLSFFVGYTGIMWIMLLLVWPGVWRWDEFWILDGSRYFIPNSYQHWLTSVLYIASLMILPFPTGVIIVQILLISFLVSFIIKTINENFLHLSNWTKWILLIPFLLFPVIDSNLYPVRCSLYAFAELAFITFLINEIFNRKRDPEYMITPNATGIFCCLSILLAVWRSESIYYLVLAPILYMLIFKGKTQKINLLLLIGVMGGGQFIRNKISEQTSL